MTKKRVAVSLINLNFETEAWRQGFRRVAGVDEVGRGALAGPVVAAACILNPDAPLPVGLNDSKQLSRAARERISAELQSTVAACAVGVVEADEIDRINILRATLRAMSFALERLDAPADYLLLDAVKLDTNLPQKSIIRGDAVSASIAAASVLAKVYRDNLMREYDRLYPQYGFVSHVGYGTRAHLAALREHGACPLHRRSFRGVLPEV
jgi:ribonuclease HII